MNKKLIISLGVIAFLLLYLIVANNDKSSKNVPEIKGWEMESTEILIDKKGESLLKIIKKDGKWLIGDAAYPADKNKVNKLETGIKDLKITDFVSRGPYYEKYNLTTGMAIRITIKSDSAVLRDILVGKKSSTNRSTYVKFPEKNEIYLASGSLTDEYNKDVADIRDMEIYKVDKSAVESLELRYKGKKLTFEKIKEEVKEDKDAKPEDLAKKKTVEKWICKEFKKLKLDKGKVDALVNGFSSIRANSFPEKLKKESLKSVICIVKGKAYNKDITLKIHKKDNEDKYVCSSSESPYAFTLNEWNAKKFFKKIHDLTEKKK